MILRLSPFNYVNQLLPIDRQRLSPFKEELNLATVLNVHCINRHHRKNEIICNVNKALCICFVSISKQHYSFN